MWCLLLTDEINYRIILKLKEEQQKNKKKMNVSIIDVCDEDNMTTFNCSRNDFIAHERGPQMQNLLYAIPITLVYSLILLAGIVGNLIVCIVIVRNSSMHTATNYYLFNLAVSDMVYLLFGLPFDILVYWHQYPWLFGLPFCKFRSLLTEACSYVSVLTIVAFSMERFLAICYPLHSYTMSGLKRAVRIIAAIWLISLLSATPFAYYRTINYIRYPPPNNYTGEQSIDTPESAFCGTFSSPPGLYQTSTIVFFTIPMLIICILYTKMAIEIRSRSKHTKELGIRSTGTSGGSTKQSKSRRAIIKMLAVVVLTFFICWTTFHAQRIVSIYGKRFELIHSILFAISGFFYYFSCTINPIIYNMMSHRYRVAFRETLCGKKQHKLISTPRQLSRKTTGSGGGSGKGHGNSLDTGDTDVAMLATQLSDPFDAETGSFPRTRSLRLSQKRMQRTASVQSRAISLNGSQKEPKDTAIIT
ncbi:neuropeptides capa receptor-like [Contarinia nasturtii]|uniref:neuropeptides capa receptor-like n=1 Tax=Contarinia nasturtii TaxID=265458 RepID=UPI0012D46749|nr:neuropeptides capa receptor-like [Contarinia nasturtii]